MFFAIVLPHCKKFSLKHIIFYQNKMETKYKKHQEKAGLECLTKRTVIIFYPVFLKLSFLAKYKV